jgi:hypothetical protein
MKNLQIVLLIVVIYLFENSYQLPNRQKRNAGRSLFSNKNNNVPRTVVSNQINKNSENLPQLIHGNHWMVGDCLRTDHELLYYDDTAIENSGPSTLNGTMEVILNRLSLISCF